VFFECD
jgi:hypothetical protein